MASARRTPIRDALRKELIARLESLSRVVETRRGPIEIAEAGEGRPVLFLHGAPGGCDDVLLISRQYAGRRWIGPSRPGYLRTPLSIGGRVEEQADALADLLDALGVDQLPLLAHSTGAPVAVHFAARHPERCEKLILAAGVSRPLNLARAGRRVIRSLPPLMSKAEVPGYASAWLFRRLAAAVARARPRRGVPLGLDLLPMFTEGILPADRRAPGYANDILELASLAPLPFADVRCPVLLIHSAGDMMVPFAHHKHARRQLQHARTHVVPLGPHYGIYLPTQRTRRQIAQFLGDGIEEGNPQGESRGLQH